MDAVNEYARRLLLVTRWIGSRRLRGARGVTLVAPPVPATISGTERLALLCRITNETTRARARERIAPPGTD